MIVLAAACVTAGVVTDKTEYIVGETAHVIYINTGNDPDIPGPDYAFWIREVSSGLTVLYDTFWVGAVVMPGESVETPHATGTLPDPPGEYVVLCRVGSWIHFAGYTLDGGIADETMTWSGVKKLYR